MQKALRNAIGKAVDGNGWQKFVKVTVQRGKTTYPKKPADQESVGVRWDYDGEVAKDGEIYHKFQMQPNAGKVPSSIKRWRDSNGGTHAVMATALVKKDSEKEDVEQALTEAAETVQ